jgi:cell division protein DivIC
MQTNGINKFRLIFKRLQILLVILISFVAIITVFLPKIRERINLLKKHDELVAKISQLEKEIERLRKQQIALQTSPHYVEKLARNKLGYSKPDEIIYKFE